MKRKTLFILGLCTLLTVSPLYASTNTLPTLTLTEATTAALNRSRNLSLNAQEANVLTEKIKYSNDLSLYVYQQLQISQSQNKQEKEFLQDQISYNVLKQYNTLYLADIELANLQTEIELKIKERDQLIIKNSLGLATTLEIDSANLELQNLQSSLVTKQENLTSTHLNFKVLTNKTASDFALESAITFEPFEIKGSVESYFKNKIDIYLKYQKELGNLQYDSIWDNFVTAPTYAEYLEVYYNADNTLASIKDREESLLQTLMSQYTSLLSLGEQIKTLEQQYYHTQNQLSALKTQYELGMITTLTYDKQCLSLNTLEYNLLTAINNYTLQAAILEKPWLM